MQYLIDVLGVEVKDMTLGFQQRWSSTHDTPQEVIIAIARILLDPFVCDLVVLSWEPGTVRHDARCVHGGWSARNTAGGIPRQKVLTHKSRPVTHEIWDNQRLAGFVFGPWEAINSSVGIEPTTQPGPGFALKPDMRLGRPIQIQAGLRATCRDPAVAGPILAFFPGYGWRRFDAVETTAFG